MCVRLPSVVPPSASYRTRGMASIRMLRSKWIRWGLLAVLVGGPRAEPCVYRGMNPAEAGWRTGRDSGNCLDSLAEAWVLSRIDNNELSEYVVYELRRRILGWTGVLP